MDKRINSLLHSSTFFQSMALIVCSSLLLSGCGGENKISNAGFQLGAQMAVVENIDSNQRNIATRICYAYQSKNSNFNSSDFLGTKFNFSVNQKTCESKTNTNSVNVTTILKKENEMFLYSTTVQLNFYQNVQTNTLGYLSQLCAKINSNQDISNTINLNGNTVQINFFTDKMDGFKLSYFTLDKNSNYKINSTETFRVRTQYNFVSGTILGMDENYTKQQVCPLDSNNYFEVDQKFISHI